MSSIEPVYPHSSSFSVPPNPSKRRREDEIFQFAVSPSSQRLRVAPPASKMQPFSSCSGTYPNSGKAYLELVYMLNGEIPEEKRKREAQINLCRKAIELDPFLADAYLYLGQLLPCGSSIKLHNGTVMTRDSLYYKARDLLPSIQIVEQISIISCKLLSNWSELQARRLIPELCSLGSSLKTSSTLSSTQNECDISARIYPSTGKDYLEVAQMLDGKFPERIKIEAQKALCLRAINLDPNLSEAYWILGELLSRGESIELNNGISMSQRMLFLKAVDINPDFGKAYFSIFKMLGGDRKITLLNGSVKTDVELLNTAINNCSQNSLYFTCLGVLKGQGEAQMHFINGIKSTPSGHLAYFCLARTLTSNEKVEIPDWGIFSQRELLFRTIEKMPSFGKAYSYLALTLRPDETILLFGKELSQEELFLRGIDLNSCDGDSYYLLALHTPDGSRSGPLRRAKDKGVSPNLRMAGDKLPEGYFPAIPVSVDELKKIIQ